jgi:hypothetical protein
MWRVDEIDAPHAFYGNSLIFSGQPEQSQYFHENGAARHAAES